MIKIDFEKTSPDGLLVYRDAIYLPEDHTYTDADIEVMKQARFDTWYQLVTNPPAIQDPAVIDIPTEQVT